MKQARLHNRIKAKQHTITRLRAFWRDALQRATTKAEIDYCKRALESLKGRR